MISREISNASGLVNFLLKNVNTYRYRIEVTQDRQTSIYRIAISEVDTRNEVWVRNIADGVNKERFSLPDMFCKNQM